MYFFLNYFSKYFHENSFSWIPFTFLRSSHQMEAFPFRLKMVIRTFKFSEQSWNLKYFFNPSIQTSTYSPLLISPLKVGGFYFLNTSGQQLLECFLFLPLFWECELVLVLEYFLDLSVSSLEDSSNKCILAPCWAFFEVILLVWPL
jgi:hypothetical protein